MIRRDPFILHPNRESRRRIIARRDKWRAAERHRRRMTPQEVEEEELRLQAEIETFLANRNGTAAA